MADTKIPTRCISCKPAVRAPAKTLDHQVFPTARQSLTRAAAVVLASLPDHGMLETMAFYRDRKPRWRGLADMLEARGATPLALDLAEQIQKGSASFDIRGNLAVVCGRMVAR